MLKNAFSKNSLIKQSSYRSLDAIIRLAEKRPSQVRAMFMLLFDEDIHLIDRLQTFKSEAKAILDNEASLPFSNAHQDHLAMMGYLSFRYPGIHYFYKYGVFKNFIDLVEYPYSPKVGAHENVTAYEKMCNVILSIIREDQELLNLNKNRYRKHHVDDNYHLLVQDILYSLVYYEQEGLLKFDSKKRPDLEEEKSPGISVKEFKPTVQKYISDTGHATKVDYREKHERNKELGDAGETFVFNYERNRVKSFDPAMLKDVKWISRDKGDGLGYDIESVNEHGETIYIEVKTTRGSEKTPFHISHNELEKSKEFSDSYYLYRVHDFDVKSLSGNISWFKGSLETLCVNPTNFIVVIS